MIEVQIIEKYLSFYFLHCYKYHLGEKKHKHNNLPTCYYNTVLIKIVLNTLQLYIIKQTTIA